MAHAVGLACVEVVKNRHADFFTCLVTYTGPGRFQMLVVAHLAVVEAAFGAIVAALVVSGVNLLQVGFGVEECVLAVKAVVARAALTLQTDLVACTAVKTLGAALLNVETRGCCI